jgi:hypothetical protein
MKARSLGLFVVLAVGLLAAPASARTLAPTADPEGAVIGATYGRGAAGPGSYAVLIDVHELKAYKNHGKPVGASNCTNGEGATSSSAYLHTGWRITTVLPVRLNPATVPSDLSAGIMKALEDSWDAWSAAEPAAPQMNVATGSAVTKYTANRVDDLLFGRTGGSLATTYTWQWNDGTVESDTVFDKGVTWTNFDGIGDGCYEGAALYDVQNIATHEFGHSYGLDHPNGRFETMYAYGFSGETLKRTLGAGDIAGIRARY